LCDGCGKCCLHKIEDEDTGDVYATNVACRLLDRQTGFCSDYKHRRAYVAECVRLTASNVEDIAWLPRTCAYRLRANDEPLPHWHYLVSGDREAVHAGLPSRPAHRWGKRCAGRSSSMNGSRARWSAEPCPCPSRRGR